MFDAHQVADAVVRAGRLVLAFGRVDRKTYHPDAKTRESDTDHTVMLGIIGCGLAAEYFPQLDLGLIAQLALVHDVVEAYAGDTNTLRMPTAEAKAEKEHREAAAFRRINQEFLELMPWLPVTITAYETRSMPEARFVKALDKLLPKVTHLLNGAATITEQGMTREELAARYTAQIAELEQYASDFPELFELREVLVDRVLKVMDRPGPDRAPAGIAEPTWRQRARSLPGFFLDVEPETFEYDGAFAQRPDARTTTAAEAGDDLATLREEMAATDALCARMTELLTGIAAGLKGDPPSLTMHDWADLPALAATMRDAAQAARDAAPDPGLIRWCGWPGCFSSYNAATGPTTRDWKRVNSPDLVLCGPHASLGHFPQLVLGSDQFIRPTCTCGTSAEERRMTLGDLALWWREHVEDVPDGR
jgi:putative hydrolase of HD superfamily